MDDFLFELRICLSALQTIMSYEELTEFLNRDYHNVTPSQWQCALLEHPLLMPRGSSLHRLFRRSGIYDEEEMTTIVLQLFYLQRQSQ